ncbi:MAG: heme exporter protein CcmD [Pseudomonadota bacterium]
MPDLGEYGFEVMLAYAGALGLLTLLIAVSWWRAAKVRRALAEMEEG